METFELTNQQREYLGLNPIEKYWDKVIFQGDNYRSDSILYFDGDIIKRHIISTGDQYSENQLDEHTKDRLILLPKTSKGKEKKLSASTLAQRQPTGVYVSISSSGLSIANYSTQTTFYSNRSYDKEHIAKSFSEQVTEFIEQSSDQHLQEINEFKNSKRKLIKYSSGDYFCFKLDRVHFGFGRLLLDVGKICKKKLIEKEHGLNLLMGHALIVQLFAYKSISKSIDISFLDKQPTLPSDVMMDNILLYGEFEIIGHKDLTDEEFEFPISYGKCISQRSTVFFQWGLIHLEISQKQYFKYVTGAKDIDQNPYGYYSVGFGPHYGTDDVLTTIENNGKFDFSNTKFNSGKWDLRNPNNKEIKNELFTEFGLDSDKSYLENCKLKHTILPTELIKKL